MAKAVFTTKINPTYDDLPEVRYHFPKTYLNQAVEAVNDWIVYYEPRRSSGKLSSRGGRQCYFAIARVDRIEKDPKLPDHFYAYVSDYLEFDNPVPFRKDAHYFESMLVREDGKTNKGAFGRAVRIVPDVEFELIVTAGFSDEVLAPEVQDQPNQEYNAPGISENQAPFQFAPTQRRMIETTMTKPFREAAFRRQVRAAYDNRCAMSGLRLINGGGRPEVQAAHVMPVADQGPDSIRNRLALSGTLHWMFDRGLVSIADDYSILRSKKFPADIDHLIVPDGRLLIPDDETVRPHPTFLRYHRENIFKE